MSTGSTSLCLTAHQTRRLAELMLTTIVQVEALIAGIDTTRPPE